MRGGDQASTDWIAQLYDRYGAALYRYALMLVTDHEAAADAVQNVFVSLMRQNVAALETEDRYLRRAVRNQCFSILRGRRRQKAVSNPGEFLEAAAAHAESPDDRLAVEQALRDIPPEQREVVHLKIFEGLTFNEIAEVSGESINTVKSRYRYALEKLRCALKT